jgi:hypothetical protein
MSSISERYYTSDTDVLVEIKKILEKDKYKALFLFLYDHFKEDNRISAGQVAKAFCIPYYSRAFQLLQSFYYLKLLHQHKTNGRDKVFLKINDEFWEHTKKGLK